KARANRRMATAVLALVLFAGGCANEVASKESLFTPCGDDVPGDPWLPAVPGASSINHDPTVQIIKTVQNESVPILGLGQGADCSSVNFHCPDTASRIKSFSIDM